MSIARRLIDSLVAIASLIALAIPVAGVSYAVGRKHAADQLGTFIRAAGEIDRLRSRYGPQKHSEYAEEWILRDFFQDQRGGTFVDVGANDYQHHSNTFYLDHTLGWSGLAIEPQQKFAADYAKYRPRTVLLQLFVSDASDRDAVLYVPPNDLIASSDRTFAGSEGEGTTPLQVKTATLDDALDRVHITHIDFLSMDIELHEPQGLKGFSIDRFRPRLVCVEAHLAVRQPILDYFADHGYVVAGKYLRADSENLWFVPRTTSS